MEYIEDGYLIHSYSAYPSSYDLRPWNMIIERSSKNYTIDKIELVDGVCSKVYYRGKMSDGDRYLWQEKDGQKEKVYPSFVEL